MCNKVSFIYYTSFNLITQAILKDDGVFVFILISIQLLVLHLDITNARDAWNDERIKRKEKKNYFGFFKRIIKVTVNFLLAVLLSCSVCIFLKLIFRVLFESGHWFTCSSQFYVLSFTLDFNCTFNNNINWTMPIAIAEQQTHKKI